MQIVKVKRPLVFIYRGEEIVFKSFRNPTGQPVHNFTIIIKNSYEQHQGL